MIKVNGKIYQLHTYSPSAQQEMLQEWRENGEWMECLCQQSKGHYPLLSVRKSTNDNYHVFNLPRNTKYNRAHADDCPFNRKFQYYMKEKGIHISGEGNYNIKLSNTSYLEKHVTLRYLTFAMLQKYRVHRYAPGEKREVHKRLYKAACESIIDGQSFKNRMYIANRKFTFDFTKHQLVIGWTNINEHQTVGNFVEIPFYSLKDNSAYTTTIKVFKNVYDNSLLNELEVKEGFLFLYRLADKKGTLRDFKIQFVPGDRYSMLPVYFLAENQEIKELIKQRLSFRKPLIIHSNTSRKIIYEK